jgi:hypothetical protein
VARTPIELELIALTKDAQKSADKFAKDTQKQLNSISFKSTVTAISTGFLAVQKAGEVAFKAISSAIGSTVGEAAKFELVQVSLNNALKLSGDFSAEAAKGFNDLASEIQRTTTFGDDQVLSAARLAKQFRLSNAETEKAIRVAADLAAATGTDLQTAIQKVAQTTSGFVDRELGRMIPALKGLSKEALISGDAIDIIGKRVQGSAVALGNTFTGALIQTENAITDLRKTIGFFITETPQVTDIIKEFQKFIVFLTDELVKNKDAIRGVVVDGMLFLISTAPTFIKTLQNISRNLTAIGFVANKAGIALGGLLAAILNPRQAGDIFSQIREDLDQLETDFGNTLNKIDDFFDPLVDGAKEFSRSAREAAKNAKALTETISGTSTSGKENRLKEQAEEIAAAAKALDDARKRLAAEESARIGKISTNVGEAVISGEIKGAKDLIAAGAGFANSILKGAEGAKKLVTDTIGAIANTIIPGIGPVVGEIVGILSQGPEEVKKQVEEFAKAIPQLIENLANSLPVLIETLVRTLPPALAKAMPTVAIGFTTALVRNIPQIVKGFAEGLIQAAKDFVKQLIKLLPGGSLLSGEGGGGGIVGTIGKIVSAPFKAIGKLFRHGGQVPEMAFGGSLGRIPMAPKNLGDGFAARLDAGEQVISRDLTNRLEEMTRGGGGGGQPIQVNLSIGLQQFAKVMLEADRLGYRVRAS